MTIKTQERVHAIPQTKSGFAVFLLSILTLCAVAFSIISLSVRAHCELTIEPTNIVSAGDIEYSEKLLNLNEESWNEFSSTERLAILQIAANYICADLDIEPVTVKIGMFEGHRSYVIRDVRYYRKKSTVLLSLLAIEDSDPMRSLRAAACGIYHAYQAECVEEYTDNPQTFDDTDISIRVRLWAKGLGETDSNTYRKYRGADVYYDASFYGLNVCRTLVYHQLMRAVETGNAVLSEPMRINNSYDDLWVAVYNTHIEIYSMLDKEIAISCYIIDPVDEFEDKNKTLASLCIDENMSNEENSNAMNDVIQFTDRDTIYRYAVDISNDTLEYVLVGTGKIAKSENEQSFDKIDWENNPIDRFFERYKLDDSTSSNADMTAYEIAKKDLWLVEVKNAYRLMKASINPNQPEEKQEWYAEMVDASLEDFLEYLMDKNRLEVYVGRLNKPVFVHGDENELVWTSTADEFGNLDKFAGDGNILHIMRMIEKQWSMLF